MIRISLFCLSVLATGIAWAAPSFDCAKASTNVEKLICANDDLGRLDVMLTKNFRGMLSADLGTTTQALRKEQLDWLRSRNRCTDVECIRQAYLKRLDETCEYAVVSGSHPECTMADDAIADIAPTKAAESKSAVSSPAASAPVASNPAPQPQKTQREIEEEIRAQAQKVFAAYRDRPKTTLEEVFNFATSGKPEGSFFHRWTEVRKCVVKPWAEDSRYRDEIDVRTMNMTAFRMTPQIRSTDAGVFQETISSDGKVTLRGPDMPLDRLQTAWGLAFKECPGQRSKF